jgi:hypothetical protein
MVREKVRLTAEEDVLESFFVWQWRGVANLNKHRT